MLRQNHNAAIYYQWHKLHSTLCKLYKTGMLRKLPSQVVLSIYKKWKRCLRKLIAVNNPLLKTFNIFCIATSLSVTANAQCDIFSQSDVNNPIKKIVDSNGLFNTSFMDIDNDGDLDCYETYVDSFQQLQFVLLRNVGTATLPHYIIDTADGFPNSGVGTSTRWNNGLPRFADIDGDGDYDCFISLYNTSSFGYSRIYFWENTGSKTTPNFVRNDIENPLALSGHYYIRFSLADVDGDGDYDMLFTDLYYSRFYKNVGTKTNPLFVQQTGANSPFNGTWGDESFYDWNKDGLPDYSFSEDGRYLKNVGTIGNAKFALDTHGPKTKLGYSGQWVDINNDGFPEIFALYRDMETTAPEATITRKNINDNAMLLTAFPKGNFLYKWRRNGKVIEDERNRSILIKENGIYTVEVKDSCGTGLSLPYKVTDLNNVFAVDKSNTIAIDNNINLLAFPNPFTSEFTIRLNSSSNTKSTIKIADVNGKTVSEFQTSNNSIQTGKQLKAGLYFVQVLQNNAVVYRQKIAKQ